MTTLIRGSWVVAFDGEKHRLIKDGEVAYEDDKITYVGKNYQGAPDEVIEAKGRLISPGFINIHDHKGIIDKDMQYRLDSRQSRNSPRIGNR